MATAFQPMREIPPRPGWKAGDVVVIFGELFSRGYVNGLVQEAEHQGLKVIFSTVGRRDDHDKLRPLTAEELKEKAQPLINVPLEGGFDLEPDKNGKTPVESLQGLKLSEWDGAKLDWNSVEQARQKGRESFLERTKKYIQELEKHIPATANVLFVHTMAGGIPRAKIVLPAMNRVFKGSGERYASSEEFWKTDLGRLCDESFLEVTGDTFSHLMDATTSLRQRIEGRGGRVAYVAYGYHGTEVLVGSEYRWQSYSPYLQGFAKLRLENIARQAQAKGVRATVYNAPEILTNSSSVFLGVEVALYPLLGALDREGGYDKAIREEIDNCLRALKPDIRLSTIMDYTAKYFNSDVIKKWSKFEIWPQHNGPDQMALMRTASTDLINMHTDPKNLITANLSELVFTACGRLMFASSWEPQSPVWWLGHDIIAKSTLHSARVLN